MTLKQGDMVVLHDNINNTLSQKLSLNMYIGSYLLFISGVNPCGWVHVFREWHCEWQNHGYFRELGSYFSDFTLSLIMELGYELNRVIFNYVLPTIYYHG